MKYLLEWEGCRVAENEWFKASVPGNIQLDYGNYKNFPDIHMGKNVEVYEQFEDDEWMYRTYFDIKPQKNERLYFVSHGIEYEYEISINGETVFSHEGMFTKAEIDLTNYLKDKNCLTVKIFPHPLSGEKEVLEEMKLKKVLNRLLDTVGIGIRDAFLQVCGKKLTWKHAMTIKYANVFLHIS